MKKIILFLLASVFSIFFLIHSVSPVAASSCPVDDPCDDIADVHKKVECYTNIVNICSAQRENMAAQVTYLTTRIGLTETKIKEKKQTILLLEEEIEKLSGKIENLEEELTKKTGMLIERIIMTYKYGNISYLNMLLTSNKFSEMMNRYKYVQTVQNHDRKLLFQLQNSKLNFRDQKDQREEKKLELEEVRKQLEKEEANLVVQKREKEVFLEVTKKNEKIFQQNLAAAKKEAQEIQRAASILSAAGVAKRVNKGEVIGVMGNTGFSTGPHLHFAVYNLNESDLDKFNFDSGYENPFNYLKSRELPFVANSCDDVGSSLRKSVGSGSWDWPMDNPTITQCFGHTPYSAAYYRSGIHNGIDMYDDGNPLLKAVDNGSAYTYRGGATAGNGVFIFHDNGKMTLYWHLQ